MSSGCKVMAFALVGIFLVGGVAVLAETPLRFSVKVEAEFTDNRDSAADGDEESNFDVFVVPRVDAKVSGDRTTANAYYMPALRYRGDPNEDQDSTALHHHLGLELGHDASPRVKLGLHDRFIFTGLVDPSRVPEMILAMDVLVHASLREGLARVLPQALLSERPVVSYDIDGAPEVVIDGETGRLVPPESIDEFAAAVADVLSDPDKARQMAQKGRELCLGLFPVERMVRDIHGVYQELVETKGVATVEE